MRKSLLLIPFLFLSFQLFSQSTDEAFLQAKKQIEATFGFYPTIFKLIPDYQVPGMWAYFGAINTPNGAIPPKYRELINLAVASQIPCEYCIDYHVEAAKAYGATENELKEAIVSASGTRAFSMILKGNSMDRELFKKEFKQMMAFMAENSQKEK